MEKNKIIKTNYIPAIVMLLAGFIYCIIGILEKREVIDFCIQLLIVLLVFYILGGIIKLVLDIFMTKTENKPVNIDDMTLDELFADGEETEQMENIFTEESNTM